ncbi:MAG: hypothetical protein WC841_04185 [Candidatus Shapirobacteria bacterium]
MATKIEIESRAIASGPYRKPPEVLILSGSRNVGSPDLARFGLLSITDDDKIGKTIIVTQPQKDKCFVTTSLGHRYPVTVGSFYILPGGRVTIDNGPVNSADEALSRATITSLPNS